MKSLRYLDFVRMAEEGIQRMRQAMRKPVFPRRASHHRNLMESAFARS